MRAIISGAVPVSIRDDVGAAIGVAGTATSRAAIAQELDEYDSERVQGTCSSSARAELLLARLAELPLEERREVRGLHPDRAPTIVAGAIILIEALRAFGLEWVEVSEHDILRGALLQRASEG